MSPEEHKRIAGHVRGLVRHLRGEADRIEKDDTIAGLTMVGIDFEARS